jgi:arylsulfatase A-like enzyme
MRRFWFLTLIALGCDDENSPRSATLADAPLAQPSIDLGAKGARVIRLATMLDQAELDLSGGHSPGADQPREWVLNDWRSRGTPTTRIWHHSLPTTMDQRSYSRAPEGLEFRVMGEPVTYQADLVQNDKVKPIASAEGRWEIKGGRILYVGPHRMEETRGVLIDATVREALTRMDFAKAGLAATDFVPLVVEKQHLTRRALLLPPPASARFPVQVPEGARLQFSVGIDGSTGKGPDSQAGFEVRVNDQQVWSGSASTLDAWSDHSVDLTQFGGQEVTLELRTTVIESPDHAFAVFADPKIVGNGTSSGPSRIVVIGLDTLRRDHVGTHGGPPSISPGLDEIAAQSIVFDEAWTPAPRTRPSFRSATTGRWPLAAINAPTLGEIFSENGWSTAGFVANVQLSPRLGFAEGFDLWDYNNMSDGDKQVDRALDWLNEHSTEDAFVFLHMMDPHIFYEAPGSFKDRFTSPFDREGLADRYNRWDINRRMKADRLSDNQKRWIQGRYMGEIAFMDQEILRLVKAIDEMPGDTTIVFHNDHGEEFWEHQGFEHNHSLYSELVSAVLWVRPPRGWGGGPHRVQHPVSLVDIAPTLAGIAGLDEDKTPDFDGLDLGPFLTADRAGEADALGLRLEERPLPLGHLMFNKEQWGVVYRDQKYILHTGSGEQELYDLKQDPGEQNNLAATTDTSDMQGALTQAHDWPMITGWHLAFNRLPETTTLQFRRPVGRAFILDPEVLRERRANLEWGETPPYTAEDVATVAVSEDRKQVVLNPGQRASGVLFIEGLAEDDRGIAKCSIGSSNLWPKGRSSMCSRRATLTIGPLLLQQDHESDRLRPSPETETIDALRSLGYMD